jgi:hypothetical protein
VANHDSCDQFGQAILNQLGGQQRIRLSLGNFDGNWDNLRVLVDQWWDAYKKWEAQDTVVAAYQEQRLTIKGTSTMALPISAFTRAHDEGVRYAPNAWGEQSKFRNPNYNPDNPQRGVEGGGEYYPIVKTNASILARMNPEVFMPRGGGESRKTELGYHDLSALLVNPNKKMSLQQYKTPEDGQVYVFMPLPYASDQAVYQNIHMLAKAYRQWQGDFYNKVKEIGSKLTRIKLAAEHDMATAFVMIGHTRLGRPKFKYTLVSKTDISTRDVQAGVVPQGAVKEGKKTEQTYLTTPGILEARRNAALNFQTLVLGEIWRYAEVVIAYRQHAGPFPKFVSWNKDLGLWIVGTIDAESSDFRSNYPMETIADRPGAGTTAQGLPTGGPTRLPVGRRR